MTLPPIIEKNAQSHRVLVMVQQALAMARAGGSCKVLFPEPINCNSGRFQKWNGPAVSLLEDLSKIA